MSAETAWPWNEGPVRVEIAEGGALWRVLLATPKANILDEEKLKGLTEVFARAREEGGLKAVVVEGEGPHFSFGASVEEHLPGRFEGMIPTFHGMFHAMLDSEIFTIAAVRGQCLGGGLELAAFCNRLIASPEAKLGQPEIQIGVLAPVASVILAGKVGRNSAEDICISGRSLGAEEARRIGLVDEIAEDPGEAAAAYARDHLLPRSASSLRIAMRAVRVGFADRFRAELKEVERIYTEDLMTTADAVEGLQSFVEKRKPDWKDG